MSGMRSSIQNVRSAVFTCSYDVVVLVETWLHHGILSSEIFDDAWIVYRCDRDGTLIQKKEGGGVLVAVRNKYGTSAITVPSNNVEQLWVTIHHETSFLLGAVYLPPDLEVVHCASYVESAQNIINDFLGADDKNSVLVYGDFNLPNVNWVPDEVNEMVLLPTNVNSEKERIVVDGFSSIGLIQISSVKCRNQLDLIFTDVIDDFCVTDAPHQLKPSGVHHKPSQTVILIDSQTRVNHSVEVFSFSKANKSSLRNALDSVDWNVFFGGLEMNEMASEFNDLLLKLFRQFVPKRLLKSSSCPWMTNCLANVRNRRNRAFSAYVNFPSMTNYIDFLYLRDEFASQTEVAYSRYIERYAEKLKTDPRCFWRFVNASRKGDGIPEKMMLDGVSAVGSNEVSELFANVFEEAYVLDDGSPFDCNLSPEFDLSSVPITIEKLHYELLHVDPKKSAGPDEIPPSFLKEYASSLAEPLHYLFSKSISSGIFPVCWKTSWIKPIFKSGNKSDMKNYRGIASLNSIPKLFEKMVTEAISPVVLPFLNASQHGFMAGRSTTTNLVTFTDYVIKELRCNVQIDAVYTDFSKAFDKVAHRLLLVKLEKLGFGGALLKWIGSYLTNRVQRVKIGPSMSREIPVLSGVPQGSHLGPLLFVIFVNDLFSLMRDSTAVAYADDLKIYKLINSGMDSCLLQEDLNRFEEWCQRNAMLLNVNKCESITFTRKTESHQLATNYSLCGVGLKRTKVIRDLGVLLDSRLTFKPHVDNVVSKASMLLGFVKRQSKGFRCPYVTKSLYCALVRSVLEYATVVWSPTFQVDVNRIESVQKQFLLFALRNLPWSHQYIRPTYTSRLQLLSMQTLKVRRQVACCLFVFDLLRENVRVPDLSNVMSFRQHLRTLRNSSVPQLIVPLASTRYESNAPLTRSARLFNIVSIYYDETCSRDTFKRRITAKFNELERFT